MATGTTEGGLLDADLANLIAAWPALPTALRRAVLAIVGSHVPCPAPRVADTTADADQLHPGYEPPAAS